MLARHETEPPFRHLRFRHDLLQTNAALDAAVTNPLGELCNKRPAVVTMCLGLFGVGGMDDMLIAHLRRQPHNA